MIDGIMPAVCLLLTHRCAIRIYILWQMAETLLLLAVYLYFADVYAMLSYAVNYVNYVKAADVALLYSYVLLHIGG